jgi:hypothetical protein
MDANPVTNAIRQYVRLRRRVDKRVPLAAIAECQSESDHSLTVATDHSVRSSEPLRFAVSHRHRPVAVAFTRDHKPICFVRGVIVRLSVQQPW